MMGGQWKTHVYNTQLCVVGGGLAGVCAAVSAARHGIQVVLVQDRPMLGGNCSSEIRMHVRGAQGKENKETGLLSELELEAIYRNPEMHPFLWDSVIYGLVKAEKNITCLLNTSCIDAELDGASITSIRCWQLTTYSWHVISADCFADCSGDSVLSVPSGALYRTGREAKSVYGESMEKEQADRKSMGMSILLQAKETDHPVPFIPPSWAYAYTDESFSVIPYDEHHSGHRDHNLSTDGCNFWWIEIGGEGNVLDDAETDRDELLKTAYGIWDHVKNHCKEQDASCWDLEWIGFLPGKRESRRYIGQYVLTQNDIQTNKQFADVVAYGGWPLDDHNPNGFLNHGNMEEKSQFLPTPSPYQIPLRVLVSKNRDNLLFAGRNISVTHAALSSTRVMGTCAVLGQALGTAVAVAFQNHTTVARFMAKDVEELQHLLLDDYCFLPHVVREMPFLSLGAELNLPEEQKDILFDGIERMTKDGKTHSVAIGEGNAIVFRFHRTTMVSRLRMVLDLDFTRSSVSPFTSIQKFAMRCHMGRDYKPVSMPKNLAKAFSVEVDDGNGWREIYRTEENRKDLFVLPIHEKIQGIRIVFTHAWGSETSNVFACDVC
jgi:hypothetical protein